MIVSLITSTFFLHILSIQSHGENTFDCTGYEDDSLHPMVNSKDCRYYWHCIFVDTTYMRAIKRKCPAGTEFHSDLKECEIANLVNCVKPQSVHTYRQQQISIYTHPSTTQIEVTTTTTLTTQQVEVLSVNKSDLIYISMIEKFLKKLMIVKQTSISHPVESETTIRLPLTSESPTHHLRQHRRLRRHNRMLNILTSNEHKIEHFSINQTHGLLIHCNEIRRRHLRDIIFYTTTTHSLKNFNSSSSSSLSKISRYNIFSLTLFISFFLFLQK